MVIKEENAIISTQAINMRKNVEMSKIIGLKQNKYSFTKYLFMILTTT